MSFAAFIGGAMRPTIDRYKAEQETKRRLEEYGASAKLEKALNEWEFYSPEERAAVAPELDKILKQKKGYSADLLGKSEQGYKFLKGALEQQKPIQQLEQSAASVAARPVNLGGTLPGPETLDAVEPGAFEQSPTPIQLPSRPVSLPPLPIEGADIPRVSSNVLQLPASQRAAAVKDYKTRQAEMLARQSKVGEIGTSPLGPEDKEVAIESLYLPPGVLSARERAALGGGGGQTGLTPYRLINPKNPREEIQVQATRSGHYIKSGTGELVPPEIANTWIKRPVQPYKTFITPDNTMATLDVGTLGQQAASAGSVVGEAPGAVVAGPPTQLTTITDASGPKVVEYQPRRGGGAGGGGNIRTVATGAVKGTVPPLPESTQRELTGLGTGAQSLGQLQELLPKIATGPVWGRLRNIELRFLGGFGTTPEEVEAATQINMLMRSAFDVAGANFTEPEMRIFRTIYPQQTDTLQTALTKIPQSLQYIQNRMRARQGLMTPMQRSQTQFPDVSGGQPSKAVSGNSSSPRIGEYREFPNGNVGVWDGKGWKKVNRPSQ